MRSDRRCALRVAATMLAAVPPLVASATAQVDSIQVQIPAESVNRVAEARAAVRDGDAARAEALLKEVLLAQPDYYRAQYNLGLSLLEQNRPKEAATALEKAAEIRERAGLEEPTIFNSLGWAHYLAGEYGEAEKAYKVGVTLAAKNTPASNQKLFNNLGSLYLRLGKLEEAEAAFRRARDEYGSKLAIENLEVVSGLRQTKIKR